MVVEGRNCAYPDRMRDLTIGEMNVKWLMSNGLNIS